MKNDSKKIITIMSIGAMLFFVTYILYEIEITTDIALMFFGAFISAFSTILSYFFTQKVEDDYLAKKQKEQKR